MYRLIKVLCVRLCGVPEFGKHFVYVDIFSVIIRHCHCFIIIINNDNDNNEIIIIIIIKIVVADLL